MSLFDKIRVPFWDEEDSSLTTEEYKEKMKRQGEEAMKDPDFVKRLEEDRKRHKSLVDEMKAELEISDPEGVKRLGKFMRDRGIQEKERNNRENREE